MLVAFHSYFILFYFVYFRWSVLYALAPLICCCSVFIFNMFFHVAFSVSFRLRADESTVCLTYALIMSLWWAIAMFWNISVFRKSDLKSHFFFFFKTWFYVSTIWTLTCVYVKCLNVSSSVHKWMLSYVSPGLWPFFLLLFIFISLSNCCCCWCGCCQSAAPCTFFTFVASQRVTVHRFDSSLFLSVSMCVCVWCDFV